MPPHSGFPNYYELFDIPVTATPAEIRAGHLRAAARDSSLQHQNLCNAALAVLENQQVRDEYDKELREHNKKQLEVGTNKTNTAARTIEEVNDALDSADRRLKDADEIIFDSKFANQTKLMAARRDVHRLCRAAVDDADRVRKWSQQVLEFCEEADRHVAEIQYLMKTQAKGLEGQIRKAERDAQNAAKHAQHVADKAKEYEDEVEKLLRAAPAGAGPAGWMSKTAGFVTTALSWTHHSLELTFNIVKYTVGLIVILLVTGMILYVVSFFL